jgi:thioredoxin-like negative regulator of GroEL
MAETYPFKVVTEAEFQDFREKKGWLLLDLYGKACPSCTSAAAHKNIAEKYAAQAYLLRVDIRNAPRVVKAFQIIRIPRLILFKDGARVSTLKGNPDPDGKNVLGWLKDHLPDGVPASPSPLAGSPLPTACPPST